jgi:hypothetical protein
MVVSSFYLLKSCSWSSFYSSVDFGRRKPKTGINIEAPSRDSGFADNRWPGSEFLGEIQSGEHQKRTPSQQKEKV